MHTVPESADRTRRTRVLVDEVTRVTRETQGRTPRVIGENALAAAPQPSGARNLDTLAVALAA